MARFNRKQFGTVYKRIDVPMDMLYTCFYCGCIATEDDHVPAVTRFHDYKAIYDRHAPLLVPSCNECNDLLSNSMQETIYERFHFCKKKLTAKHSKIIRYGEIWTEDAAEYADFSGNFEVFVEQAQRMAKIVKQRLDWMHWPVSIDGESLEVEDESLRKITIFNKTFTSMDHLFEHARKVDKISPKYLQAVVDVLGGIEHIQRAYVICKNNKVKSEAEMRKMLIEIKEGQEE